jgi:hypothetical protein
VAHDRHSEPLRARITAISWRTPRTVFLLQHGRLRAPEETPIIPRVTRHRGQLCATPCIQLDSQSIPYFGGCRITGVFTCTAFIFSTVRVSDLIRMLDSRSDA